MTMLARAAASLLALAFAADGRDAAAQQSHAAQSQAQRSQTEVTQEPRSAWQALFESMRANGAAAAEPDAAAQGGLPGAMILTPTPADSLKVELWFLPEDAARLDASPEAGAERLVITGAYSSGDRFAPEGFVIRGGDATHPYPQGWDGLLLVDGRGRASIHDVARVRLDGQRYDLRDKQARKRFLERASAEGMSAIQSHLLINDGRLDVSPSPSARRFRRRLLFETRDGALGVFDTSPAQMTLYEAAQALMSVTQPRMALNLDMGTYDFCERHRQGAPEQCGLLTRGEIQKLTNLIAITRPGE